MKDLYIRRMLACAVLLSSQLLLTACATFSPDGGFNQVSQTVNQYIDQEPVWIRNEQDKANKQLRVETLLSNPLSVDEAVQLALINNPQLQADLYSLQQAESDLVQAGRLSNPSYSLLYAKHDGEFTIEQSLTINIMSLFFLNQNKAIEQQHFAVAQQRAVLQILSVARNTRNAYIHAVAAKQQVQYLTDVEASAKASYQLAKRMRKAGNWSVLDEGREQTFFLEAALNLRQAENDCVQAIEHLTRMLGLNNNAQMRLPVRLNDLPHDKKALRAIQADDFKQRLDLQQLQWQSKALAKQLGLTKISRWVNMLEIGPASVLEGSRHDPSKKGLELRFELPIFDWGTARVKRAEANYQQFLNSAKAKTVNAASEVRAQHQQYLAGFEIAQRYRDEVIPLKKQMLDESLLRYNGMLMSPFELMVTAREQVLAVNHYIAALRDFWIADSNLQMTMIGAPMSEGEQ